MKGHVRGAMGRSGLLLCGLLGAGCQVGRAMIATSSDYGDYRRVRLADTADERLAAAWYYLRHQSDGRYAERLRAFFLQAEPAFWAVRRRTEAGLEAYLQALPDGPHAAEALEELMRLRRIHRRDQARELDPARLQARLDREWETRLQAGGLGLTWLGLLLSPGLWDHPLDEAPDAFLVAYRLEAPPPSCEPDEALGVVRCTKAIERTFQVVVDDELVERPVLLWLDLELDASWRLRRARLLGPELFVRRAEALSRRPIAPDDAAARQAAVEQFEGEAMELLAAPALGCAPADVPAGLGVVCRGLRVVLKPGGAAADDEITVERMAPLEGDRAVAPTGTTEDRGASSGSEPAPGDLYEP